MRFLFGFICVLALGVMPMVGCGEGGDPFPGNCGNQGVGGGATVVLPGLYRAGWDDESATYDACVYVNEDCTELEASTECNIGEDDSQAYFLELEWTDGRDELGGVCTARVSVTPDLVTQVPIDRGCNEYNCTGFRIEFSDAEGADWSIGGSWDYDILHVYAERTTADVVCRSHADYPPGSICLGGAGSEQGLCLLND